KEYEGGRFARQRRVPWDEGASRLTSETTAVAAREAVDIERMPHGARRILSVIDIPLWEKAHWKGAVYACSDDPRLPPILGLAFEDQQAGVEIFDGWRERRTEIGEIDLVRIAILTGIDKVEPYAYTMVIGAEVSDEIARTSPGGVFTVSRVLHMNPSTPKNLDNFVESYPHVGRYVLVPAVFTDPNHPPRLLTERWIMQKKLLVRAAWEVGENDPDVVGLSLENDPIIPLGMTEPPVRAALKRIAERRGRPGAER